MLRDLSRPKNKNKNSQRHNGENFLLSETPFRLPESAIRATIIWRNPAKVLWLLSLVRTLKKTGTNDGEVKETTPQSGCRRISSPP